MVVYIEDIHVVKGRNDILLEGALEDNLDTLMMPWLGKHLQLSVVAEGKDVFLGCITKDMWGDVE